MSLVRGVTYCAHPIGERELIPQDRFTKKIDQGENRYSFRLTVCQRGELERRATEFVQKPIALNIFPVPSKNTSKELSVKVGGDIISMPAMKKMCGDGGVAFRLLNNTPEAVESYIEINGCRLDLHFGKYEVKTVVYRDGGLRESYELLV